MATKRTNVEIDEQLLSRVMERHALRTMREAVDFALRRAAGEPMTREEALAMEGAWAIGEVPPDTGPPEL